MGSQGFHNVAGNPFVYQEDTMSAAMGLDVANQYWKLVVSASGGALPTGTAQLTIDPAVNGNITIDPNGSGSLVVTSGDVSLTAGNLLLPTTSSTVGQIQINSVRELHAFGTGNTFVGESSGNFTLTVANSAYNVGCGRLTLNKLTLGSGNCCLGNAAGYAITEGNSNVLQGSVSGYALTTGSYNLGCGDRTIYRLTTGSYNVVYGSDGGVGSGYGAGYNYTGAESSNVLVNHIGVTGESNVMRLGTAGNGNGQVNKAFIAGIYGSTVGATNGIVQIDNAGQLGSTNSPSVTGSITAGTNLVSTAGNLLLPATSSATVGVISKNDANGTRYSFIHAYGDSAGPTNSYNVFIGLNAGNFTMTSTARYNIGIGAADLLNSKGVLHSLTSGEGNTCLGYSALVGCTSGSNNTAFGGVNPLVSLTEGNSNFAGGSGTLRRLVTGSYNLALGASTTAYTDGSGYNLTGAESNNILLNHLGVTGASNELHIGTGTGSAKWELAKAFIAGIYGVTPAGTLNVALVDSNGQFGSVASLAVGQGGTGVSTLTDHGVLLGSGTGAITATAAPTDGQLLIGYTGADPSLATLTAGTNVTVTNAAGAITLSQTTVGINPQTADYVLVLGDAGKLIKMTVTSTANTVTIPKNSSVAFPTGTFILIEQAGTGQTTVIPVDGDVTINSSDALVALYGQYSVAAAIKVDTDVWVLMGDLA